MPNTLELAAAASILREATKDKSYQTTPVGVFVGRYIRWFRNEWGATPQSVRDYEAILSRMAISLADRELYQVQTEDLRAVIDLWAAQSNRTRQKVTSVIRAFWSWAEAEGHIAISPAARIRRPRAERKVARVLPANARPALLASCSSPRDRMGLFILLGCGVRRAELAGIQVRNIDRQRRRLWVYGKGRKERMIALRGPVLAELDFYLAADLPGVGRPPQQDDYLLYPIDRRANGKGSEGQMRYAYVGRPKDPMAMPTIHRWWYDRLEDAGLVSPGTTRGLNMHQARHLFAQELRRVAGLAAASQALGHSDLSTTLGIYGHQEDSDHEQAMDRYAEWLEEHDA